MAVFVTKKLHFLAENSAICFDLCLTQGPVRLHHAIFLNITQPKGPKSHVMKGTNLKIYPMSSKF